MAKISTNGVKKNDYQVKELRPGQVEARIISLAVKKVEQPRDPSVPEFNIEIGLLGRKPSKDFVGLAKDFQNPAKGNYDGPYKRIKHGTWSIKAFEYKNKEGKKVSVDANSQIIQVLQEICEAYGKPNLFDEKKYTDGFNTWSDLIKSMNVDLNFKETFVWFCLGGTKTKNDKGYDVYFLNLVEKKTLNYMPRIAATKEALGEYDESVHLYKKDNPTANNSTNKDEEEDGEFNDDDETSTEEENDKDLFEGVDEFDDFEEVDEEF